MYNIYMGDNLLLGLGTKFQNPFIIISYLKFQCCHGNFLYSVKNVIHVKKCFRFYLRAKIATHDINSWSIGYAHEIKE